MFAFPRLYSGKYPRLSCGRPGFNLLPRKVTCNRLIGLVGRVFPNGPGDLGSITGHVKPNTFKIVIDTSLLNTNQYKVRMKGKVEQSWERSSAPLHLGVVAIEKGAFWSSSTTVPNNNYICFRRIKKRLLLFLDNNQPTKASCIVKNEYLHLYIILLKLFLENIS